MLNPCSGCKARCCSDYLVTVNSFDLKQIADATGKKPDEFAEFYPAKILNYDWDMVLAFYGKGPLPDFCLLALKSWPCIFLKESKCSIHGLSPFVCRRYPFNTSGSMVARHCSLLSKALFILNGPEAQGEQWKIGAYKKIVKEWNAAKGKKEDCMVFLMEKTANFKE